MIENPIVTNDERDGDSFLVECDQPGDRFEGGPERPLHRAPHDDSLAGEAHHL